MKRIQLSYVLTLACDPSMNLYVWNHVGLNISRGTELASFSAVFSFVEWIRSISRASSLSLYIPCQTGQVCCVWKVLLPWRRWSTWEASRVNLSLVSGWIFFIPRISYRVQNDTKNSFTQLVSHFCCFKRIYWEGERTVAHECITAYWMQEL